jgi:hypothetical protein
MRPLVTGRLITYASAGALLTGKAGCTREQHSRDLRSVYFLLGLLTDLLASECRRMQMGGRHLLRCSAVFSSEPRIQ